MKRFSDFAKTRTQLPGDKVSIDDILNKEIIILDFRIYKSKYKKNNSGEYLTIQFRYVDTDKRFVVFTGSDVLINQANEYADEVPFQTIIVKVDKYYTFS